MENPQKKRSMKRLVCDETGVFDPARIFILAVLSGLIFCICYYTVRQDLSFSDMFFRSGGDLFMDFFNSIRDAAQGAAVYTERRVIYPPLANLLFLFFSLFLPRGYLFTSFEDRETWVESPSALLLVFACFFLFLLALYMLLRERVERPQMLCVLFSFSAVLSFPVLYCVERGNVILLSLLLLAVYAASYNSKLPIWREIGLICLAASFALKLYPALFGYFLLIDKRYHDAIRTALYGILMLLIPSLFFGGPACLVTMMKNVISFSAPSGGGNFTSSVSFVFGISESVLSGVFFAWTFCCLAALIASPFVHREKRWKSWALGAVLILTVPSLTSSYNCLFLLLPLVLLINDKHSRSGYDLFLAILLILPFVALPSVRSSLGVEDGTLQNLSLNVIVVYVVTTVLSVVLVVETVLRTVRLILEKRRASTRA